LPAFSIDTSALIHAWVRAYPPDVVPTFWERFDDCIAGDIVIASREVLGELEAKADDLYKWAKERSTMFHEIDDDVQAYVSRLMARYPKLVDERTNKSAGDPWVMALASVRGLAVVTQETGGTDGRPTIPHVCGGEGIRCINLLEFMRELKWRI
jgi:hypothetical protein